MMYDRQTQWRTRKRRGESFVQDLCRKMLEDFDISQEDTSFLCCKQNLVLVRLAYSHCSLHYANFLRHPLDATLSWTRVQQLVKLEFMVYKVLNMDIFLIQRLCVDLEGLYQPRGAVWSTFMMDWMHFFGLQNLDPHSLPFIKLGRSWTYIRGERTKQNAGQELEAQNEVRGSHAGGWCRT